MIDQPTFGALYRQAKKQKKLYIERPNTYENCLHCGRIAFPAKAGSRMITDVDVGDMELWFSPEYCFNCIV